MKLLDQLNKSICARWTTLRIPDSGGQRLQLIASAGVDWPAANDLLIASDDAAAKAFASGELVLADGSASPLTNGLSREQSVIRSLIHIPVKDDTQVVGVLSIGSEYADALQPETSSVLTAYAQALGVLLQSDSALNAERPDSAAETSLGNRVENSQQAIDSRFRAVIAQSPDMVFVSRLDDFRFVEVNDRACEHYGYSREEFLEMEIFDIEIEPPLREQVKSLYDSTLPGQEVEVFGTNKRKDGTTFPVHVRFAKMDDALAIANVRDISDVKIAEDSLKDSEAKSNALLEEAPHGIIVADANGVILRVNRQLEVQFGYSREELIGSKVEVLIPDSTRPKHSALRMGYAENPTSRLMGEGLRLSGLRKDGSEFPVEIGLSSIESSDGRLTLAHVMDDTQRRELEDFLTTTGEQLGDQLEAREAEMDLVERVARIFTSSLDINQVLAEFAEEAKNLVDFNQITIIAIDYATESLVVNRYLRAGSMANEPRVIYDLKGSQTEQVLLTGKTIIRELHDVDSGVYTDRYLRGVGLRSTILTPLVYNDRTIGTVLLARDQPESYGPREQRILERLAHQIAPAVENSRLYEESVSRTAKLECLLNLAEILGRAQSYEEKVFSVLEQMVQVVDAYSAHFRVYDPDTEELVMTASAGAVDNPNFPRPVRMGPGSLIYESFIQGRPLVIPNYRKDPRSLPSFRERGDRSVVLLPIGVGGEPVAIMAVDSNELDYFTPERVRLLTAVSEGLGTLMENASLQHELQAGTEEMAMVDRVADIVNSSLSLEEVCKRYTTEVKTLVDFHNANLSIIDDQTDRLSVIFLDDEVSLANVDIASWTLEGTQTGTIKKTGQTLIREDITESPVFSSDETWISIGVQSTMIVPLFIDGKAIGTLGLMSKDKNTFGQRERRIMERLANQIAPAIVNANLYREAQERTQEIQRLNESTNRILESNPSALVVLKGSHREVVMVNRSFCRTFKLQKEQVEGMPLSQVLDWVGMEEWIRDSLNSASGEEQKEVKYPEPEGIDRWFQAFAVPLRMEDDTVSEEEVLLVLNEVTEQKQQQERLQEHSRLASVGSLASGVAHEINNPLAAIHGLAELLQMDDWPAQVSEDARKIQEAAQRASRVVQNLLFFARKSEPEKRYLDIGQVVDRALELKSRDLELENIRIDIHHSPDLVPTMVDEPQLVQVILNVLTNAEQAIKSCGRAGNVGITTRMVKNMLCISISDDGPGIPEEHLRSIFDPFFTTKEVGEGTGLGLSICYGIVREHGGEMWVESVLGEGATFRIELPVLPDLSLEEPNLDDADDAPVIGKRILVVDDEPDVRAILHRALSSDGHLVTLAPEAESAWELIKSNQYDKIFLDLKMPGMGGQWLYKRMTLLSPKMVKKVVFVTGDTASSEARKFLDSTARPVLSKPFGLEAIRQLV